VWADVLQAVRILAIPEQGYLMRANAWRPELEHQGSFQLEFFKVAKVKVIWGWGGHSFASSYDDSYGRRGY
jgi:hypothetical protein